MVVSPICHPDAPPGGLSHLSDSSSYPLDTLEAALWSMSQLRQLVGQTDPPGPSSAPEDEISSLPIWLTFWTAEKRPPTPELHKQWAISAPA